MKLLFVSETKSDWEIVRNIMKANYPKVELICSINSNDALNTIAADGPFGFFIIDCNMRELDPDALGKTLIEFAGDRPILFIGHEAIIKDRISQELYASNEYNGQIFKPLDRDDFLIEFREKVDYALSWVKEEEFEQSIEEADSSDFIPMKIKSFFLYKSFPYDIYLPITSTNFIKIISADKPYSHSTLSAYAKKNVRFLLIKKDDQLKYLEGEATKCLKALKNADPHKKDMFLLQLRAVTILHQYISALGVAPTVLALAEVIVQSILSRDKIYNHITEIIDSYPAFYEGIASKSLLTSYIANAIAKKLGWESETTRKKLAIAAILQDVSLPDESMSKINHASSPKLKEFSDKEIEDFLQHPIKSAEFAKQFSIYTDIDYIIENHHELPNRKGFPNRPSGSKLTQVCSVFNTAQYIAAEIDGTAAKQQDIAKILKSMSKDYSSGVFKETLRLTKSLFKLKF